MLPRYPPMPQTRRAGETDLATANVFPSATLILTEQEPKIKPANKKSSPQMKKVKRK